MATIKEVLVPDIGDFKDIPVIEVLVKPGDQVKAEDSLITLESDKATMEVPAPFDGTVKDMRINVGDNVSEGTVILSLEESGSNPAEAPKEQAQSDAAPAPAAEAATPTPVAAPCGTHARSNTYLDTCALDASYGRSKFRESTRKSRSAALRA